MMMKAGILLIIQICIIKFKRMKYLKTYEERGGITFKEWLKKNPQDINTTTINCSDDNLIDLDGIQEFKNLEILYCNNNKLTGLDLEGLDKLWYLNCYNNNLPYKDLKGYWKWWEKEYPDRAEAKKFNF